MGRAAAMTLCATALTLFTAACGPKPPPADAYSAAPDLLADFAARRAGIRSFRITGRMDHFGGEQRIQGKVFLFGSFPGRLRIEVVSPFMSPLNVLTVEEGRFAWHDIREGRFVAGPAEPCQIARLARIPLPPDDVIRALVGDAPRIVGATSYRWDAKTGAYEVIIADGARRETLLIGPDRSTLPLLRARLDEGGRPLVDISYDRWSETSGMAVPREIRVALPREKEELLVRYDEDGVELNVDLPEDAFRQSPPDGTAVETAACE